MRDDLCSYCLGLRVLTMYDPDSGNIVEEKCHMCSGAKVISIDRGKYSGLTVEELIKRQFGEDAIR